MDKNVKAVRFESGKRFHVLMSKGADNKKLLKIGGITLKDLDWSKGTDGISQELENYFSTFWGKEHKKSIDYDADILDESIVYTNINCEWENTRLNEKSCKGSFFLMQRGKIVVIAIEPK